MFNVGDTVILKPECIYTPGVLTSDTDITILIMARGRVEHSFAWLVQNYIDWDTGRFISKPVKIVDTSHIGGRGGRCAILPIDPLPERHMWWIPVGTLLPPPPVTCTRRLTVKQFNRYEDLS